MITEKEYKIDFAVLDTTDIRYITLIDRSTYLDKPENPLLFITPPGFTGHVEIPYRPNTIIEIDGEDLELPEILLDGVYQIKMGVCPYEELNKKVCYLRHTQLDNRIRNLLLEYKGCGCISERKFKEGLMDAYLLIASAEASASICDSDKASDKYRMASKIISNLEKKLNC